MKKDKRSTLKYKWVERIDKWDCTDGVLHGGGATKKLALQDYKKAVAEELFDNTIGWSA